MPDALLPRKHWLNRPDMLTAAACGILVSAFLLFIVPSVGTLFLEVLVGAVILARAYVLKARQRKTAQLRLALPSPGSHIRRPDRYDLVVIIIAILSYGGAAAAVRGMRISEIVRRIVPLLVFATGLLAKNQILHWAAHWHKATGSRRSDLVSPGGDF